MRCIRNLVFCVLVASNSAWAGSPPSSITGVGISADAVEHYLNYSHMKFVGICVWVKWHWYGPRFSTTLEMDEYQPDLVVSVFDQPGDDPWLEAKDLIDPVAHVAGNTSVHVGYGESLGYGANNATPQVNDQNMRTYVVDVVGAPLVAVNFPWMLRSDTHAYNPYYSSDSDAAPDRMGLAEALQLNTYNPFSYYIGPSMFSNWGYLYPRVMTINQPNNYAGSVLAGLHGAAIVTNSNYLHVVQSTSNSCGTNCAVANVNGSDANAIWQEVYPLDKQIQLGDMGSGSTTPVGAQDNQAGNGNYVFLLWRHYRGCIQGNGSLVYSSTSVPPTKKM